MKKTAAKFFIVAERHNLQLGTYLMSKVYIGKRCDNKASITCVFDNFGCRESLRFSLCANTDGGHYCLNTDRCVYGSISYYGFETAESAKAYLEKNWSKHRNFACCIKQLSA